jgi:hypothetical protein
MYLLRRSSMKQIIYKSSIIIPLAMIFYSFIEPFAFCVPEIGLYMKTWSSRIMVVMVTIIWLCCSPFRRGTYNGTITELLFNFVPVEVVLMLVFDQWHFAVSLLLTLIMLVGEITLFLALRKDERKHKFSRKRHRRYQFAFVCCESLTSVTIPNSVKDIWSQAFYNCESLSDVYYTGTEEEWNNIYIGDRNDYLTNVTIHYNAISVIVNGNMISFDQKPTIVEGRTLVPLRAIFEALGAEVEWDNDTKTVTAKRGDTTVSLTIGSNEIEVNGTSKELEVSASIINDRTMVPARAVAEAFGCNVSWDNDTRSVIIEE